MAKKPITFLWPQVSSLRESGLTIRATGYENDCHWTGQRDFPSSDPDFAFWKWLYINQQLLPPVLEESFLPALMKFAASLSPEGALKAPSDGIYLNCESNGPFVPEAIDALVAAVGESSIIAFQPSAAATDEHRLMRVLCRGLAEVFVFQEGRCDFFGAIGQDREGIPMNIRLIAKRAPATPDSPLQVPGG